MQYPDSVLAKNKQGKKEVRVLKEKGQYVKYSYLDPKTNKETAKYSLLLKNNKSREHLFIIPMKADKSLVIKKSEDRKIKLWDKEKNKEISF